MSIVFTGPFQAEFLAAIKAGNPNQVRALIERGAKPCPLAFLIALRNKRSQLIPLLKEAGANPDDLNHFGARPLGRAIESPAQSDVQLVLDAGADPNLESAGLLPLIMATTTDNIDTVRLLLEYGADVNKTQKNGLSPLLWSIRCGNEDIVRVLLEAGADASYEGPDGLNSVDLAKQLGNREMIAFLHSEAKPYRRRPKSAIQLLNAAIKNKRREDVDLHIKRARDLDNSDRFDNRPLDEAVRTNDVWFVNRLLKAGADPNFTNRAGDSPLTVAVRCQRLPSIIKALLKAGAKPRALSPRVGDPFFHACGQGQFEVAKLLVEAGRKASASASFGVTALMMAVSGRSLPLVRLLISRGAAIGTTDSQGQTALFYASQSRSLEVTAKELPGIMLMNVDAVAMPDDRTITSIIQLLLSEGSDVNHRDKAGRTPLTFAASPSIARLLLSAGAKLDIRDKHNHDGNYWLKRNGIVIGK